MGDGLADIVHNILVLELIWHLLQEAEGRLAAVIDTWQPWCEEEDVYGLMDVEGRTFMPNEWEEHPYAVVPSDDGPTFSSDGDGLAAHEAEILPPLRAAVENWQQCFRVQHEILSVMMNIQELENTIAEMQEWCRLQTRESCASDADAHLFALLQQNVATLNEKNEELRHELAQLRELLEDILPAPLPPLPLRPYPRPERPSYPF